MHRLLPLALILPAACSGRSLPPVDGAPLAVADGAPSGQTTYHLEGTVDAVNLVVVPDGSFFWTINGCDFFGGDCAIWTKQGVDIELRPIDARLLFRWVQGGSFATEVVRVTLRPAGPDQVTADGVTTGGTAFKQRWSLGQICPSCGGLGPTALYPCSDPLAPPESCVDEDAP